MNKTTGISFSIFWLVLMIIVGALGGCETDSRSLEERVADMKLLKLHSGLSCDRETYCRVEFSIDGVPLECVRIASGHHGALSCNWEEHNKKKGEL